jgi:hypothetical protein
MLIGIGVRTVSHKQISNGTTIYEIGSRNRGSSDRTKAGILPPLVCP